MQLELDLERPIRHALTLTEKGNHLIEDSVKVHRAPSCIGGGQYGLIAVHGQQRKRHTLCTANAQGRKAGSAGARCAGQALLSQTCGESLESRALGHACSRHRPQQSTGAYHDPQQHTTRQTTRQSQTAPPPQHKNASRVTAARRNEKAAQALEQTLRRTWGSPKTSWPRSKGASGNNRNCWARS